MRAALEHVGHARAVGAHEALELGETSLDLLELGWVEVDLVRVVAQLGGDVLDVDEGALERVGVLGEGSVEGRGLPQHAHGLRETVGHAVIAGEQVVDTRGGTHEGLAVLGAGQPFLELLVLALARPDLVDPAEHEGGLIEALRGGTSRLANAGQLVGCVARGVERSVVGGERRGGRLPRPCVEHLHVRRHREEPLVLVLPAEVDHRSHALRELASRGHPSVKLDASAAVRRDAPAHHDSVGVSPALDETPLDLEVIGALAHRASVGALAYEQLDSREERGLSRARLAREHREPRRGDERRVMDERDIGDMQLVEHLSARLAVEDARHGGVEALRAVIEKDDVPRAATDGRMQGQVALGARDGLPVGEEVTGDAALLGHLDLDDVGGRGEKRARHDGMGCHGDADHPRELRRHDGAAGGEGIPRRARGGGDDEPVTAEAVDVVARDGDVELDHVALAAVRQREVVQGEAVNGVGPALRVLELGLDVERRATGGVKVAREGVGDGGEEVLWSGAGEKAEVTVGDAEDGYLRVGDDARGAEERAVTAERDDEVTARGIDAATGIELLVMGPDDVHVIAQEPLLELTGTVHGIGLREVWNDENPHEVSLPDRATADT